MDRYLLPLALLVAAACSSPRETTTNLTEFVNPMVGTDFTGNTYPGAQAPHGMVQLSPDNGLPGWDRISGYFYPDSTIAGFSHTHLDGTGAGDCYDISFLPYVKGKERIAEDPLGLHSRFSHDSEQARAGYYRVTLDDYGIDVELTATERTGIQRYTWSSDSGMVRLNLTKAMNWDATVEAEITPIDSVTIIGHRFSTGWAQDQRVWFVTRFSQPWTAMEVDTVGGAIATFNFDTKPGSQLTVVTAISGTDAAGAMTNLKAEAPHNDFDLYLADATDSWNSALSVIKIDGASKDEQRKFYTALYHSLLCPQVWSDADGRYRGPDNAIRTTDPDYPQYHMFSLWDTYRAAHPLYTIIEPQRAADMASSLTDFAEQNHQLPIWTMWGRETRMMIGYHSVPVMVDAVMKGLPGVDAEKVLAVCLETARRHDQQWVSCDSVKEWSMSETLEYAYDDACIARLARHMGHDSVAEEFEARAKRYVNVFDPSTRFFRPRHSDGKFYEPFTPDDYGTHICESNAWQYLWSVQHDLDGLTELLGGRGSLKSRLDAFFTLESDSDKLPIFSTGMIGQYAHGNEPGHHVAYLYNLTDSPEKGRKILKQIMTELYADRPDGLCGNEDCGQMSAWYVMSALGLYPVDPADGRYWLGQPMVSHAEIALPEGKTFTIEATPGADYTQVLLNGRKIDRLYITHAELLSGGTLRFE